MTTEFLTTVKSAAGDYTTLNAAVQGMICNLTVATTKVFSISAHTGAIADGDQVEGVTSGAHGYCVHVNAAGDQVLIRDISAAVFQSGEIVKKHGQAGDGTDNVTLSNAGDDARVSIACYASAAPDTTSVYSITWTTSETNYLKIYVPDGQRHLGVWDETKYYIQIAPAPAYSAIDFFNDSTPQNYIWFDGLQIRLTSTNITGNCAIRTRPGHTWLSNCILRGLPTATAANHCGIWVGDTGIGTNYFSAWNNIIYDWAKSASGVCAGIYLDCYGLTSYIYNNTIYNNYRGIWVEAGVGLPSVNYLKNNLVYENVDNYYDTAERIDPDVSTNNLSGSTQSDAPLSNPYNATAVSFIDEAGRDLRLQNSDTGAKDHGVDLSEDEYLDFTTDISGYTRLDSWDIGAWETWTNQVCTQLQVVTNPTVLATLSTLVLQNCVNAQTSTLPTVNVPTTTTKRRPRFGEGVYYISQNP